MRRLSLAAAGVLEMVLATSPGCGKKSNSAQPNAGGSASSGMRGTIHCAAGMPESAFVDVADNQFIPSSAHVRPGGYVKWTATGGNHTVTRP